MRNLNRSFGAVIFILLMLLSTIEVSGTDGYLSTAYGTRAKGLAGAGVAYSPLSIIGGNPAGNVHLGTQYTVGLSLFNPAREFTVTGNPSGMPGTFGLTPGTVESDQPVFANPNMGGNWMIKEDNAFAVSLYGNGGMNTNYPNMNSDIIGMPTTGIFHDSRSENTGVNLSQMFGEFTYSRKIVEKHSIGASLVVGFQMFKAYGLHAFGDFGMSADPANLTNNGMDYSFGVGFKVGYLGELFDGFTLGASFQSQTYMSKFDKYAGLFAEQGDFDIPMNWTVGVAYATDQFAVMADYKRIHYSMISSIANPMDPMALPPAFLSPGGDPMNPMDYIPNENYTPLGSDNGSGFGWEDVNVVKVGVEYLGVEDWMFRAGYSWCNQPIPETEVLFNILAPGVMEHHLGVGLTKVMTNVNHHTEFNLGFNYAFENTVTGYNPMDFDPVEAMTGNMVPNQTIDLTMRQMDFEIGFTF